MCPARKSEDKLATYKAIDDYIRKKYGRSVKSCWIAHVKELHGLNHRKSPNRISPSKRKIPCPPQMRPLIEDAMRFFGMF